MQTLNVNEVCQVRVNSRNLSFNGKMIIKFHVAKRNVTPSFWVDLTFEWYEDAMVFRVFFVIIFV